MLARSLLPTIDTLSLPALVGQMVVVRASGYLFDHQIRYPQWEAPAQTLHHYIQELGVGGVIVLGGSAPELALRIQQLQEWASIPLLTCADVEEGVGQRFPGATWFPPPMALAAVFRQDPALAEHLAEHMGAITAQEARAIGLNWLLTPTVDVNNNPHNPVINLRAFGETPEEVSRLTAAYIRGAQQHRVLTVAKHFPGHGDTATDSHLELPTLPHDLDRLQQVELRPFQTAIATHIDAVMTAHLHIPSLDPDLPATLSRPILTGLLRQTLGFEGLIVTDALVMGALAPYAHTNLAVQAVQAGADIILMPPDPAEAIAAVCAAVEAGEISEAQIRASVERIWTAKQKVCSPLVDDEDHPHAWEQVPAPTINATRLIAQLARPTTIAQVDAILQASQRVHQPALSRLAAASPGPRRNLILIDDALEAKLVATHHPAIALPSAKGYTTQICDRHTPSIPLNPKDDTDLDSIEPDQNRLSWQPTLLQLFIRSNPFRDASGVMQRSQRWLQHLIQTEQLHGLVIYGTPYGVEPLLVDLPPDIPYVHTYGQMPQAQAIALAALFS
jgi:beta-glucosidase